MMKEVVIKIPEELYNEYMIIQLGRGNGKGFVSKLLKAIKDGMPLPENHGRLIDENELIDEIVCEEIDGRYYDIIYAHSIYDANTIIEADKGEADGK